MANNVIRSLDDLERLFALVATYSIEEVTVDGVTVKRSPFHELPQRRLDDDGEAFDRDEDDDISDDPYYASTEP